MLHENTVGGHAVTGLRRVHDYHNAIASKGLKIG